MYVFLNVVYDSWEKNGNMGSSLLGTLMSGGKVLHLGVHCSFFCQSGFESMPSQQKGHQSRCVPYGGVSLVWLGLDQRQTPIQCLKVGAGFRGKGVHSPKLGWCQKERLLVTQWSSNVAHHTESPTVFPKWLRSDICFLWLSIVLQVYTCVNFFPY